MQMTQAAWLLMRKEDELRLILTDVGAAAGGHPGSWRARLSRAAALARGVCSGASVAAAGLLALSLASGLPDFHRGHMTKDEIEILDFILPHWETGLSQMENRWARLVVLEVCGPDGVIATPDGAI